MDFMPLNLEGLTSVTPAVQCSACGRWHSTTADKFIAIAGTIYIGNTLDVLPNNLDSNGRLMHATILCRLPSATLPSCAAKFFQTVLGTDPQFDALAGAIRAGMPHDTGQPTSEVLSPGPLVALGDHSNPSSELTPLALVKEGCYPIGHYDGFNTMVPHDAPFNDVPLNDEQQALLDVVSHQMVREVENPIDPVIQEQQLDQALPMEMLAGTRIKLTIEQGASEAEADLIKMTFPKDTILDNRVKPIRVGVQEYPPTLDQAGYKTPADTQPAKGKLEEWNGRHIQPHYIP